MMCLGWRAWAAEMIQCARDQSLALRGSHGEGSSGSLGQPGEDEGVGLLQQRKQLARGQSVPALKRDPVGAGEVGGWADVVALKQLGVALAPGMEGEGRPARFKVAEREHPAAEHLIAYPKNELFSPLQRFLNVREFQEKAA